MGHFTPWKPGQSGNPAGRPKGALSGRQQAVSLLDSIFAEPDVKAAIQKGLREYFLKKPVQAFRRLVLPLLPRQMKLNVEGPAVIAWKSLLEVHAEALKQSSPDHNRPNEAPTQLLASAEPSAPPALPPVGTNNDQPPQMDSREMP